MALKSQGTLSMWSELKLTLLFMNFMNNLFSLWADSPGEIVLKGGQSVSSFWDGHKVAITKNLNSFENDCQRKGKK